MPTVPKELVIELTQTKLKLREIGLELGRKRWDPMLTEEEVVRYDRAMSDIGHAIGNLDSLIEGFILGMDGSRE